MSSRSTQKGNNKRNTYKKTQGVRRKHARSIWRKWRHQNKVRVKNYDKNQKMIHKIRKYGKKTCPSCHIKTKEGNKNRSLFIKITFDGIEIGNSD